MIFNDRHAHAWSGAIRLVRSGRQHGKIVSSMNVRELMRETPPLPAGSRKRKQEHRADARSSLR
jgi:hypothetical protein